MERSLSLKYLRPPVSTHGSKQRLAQTIVDYIYKNSTHIYYDLCCGGGAISLELIKRGVPPSSIYMVDLGLWGLFWTHISHNTFDLARFDHYVSHIPTNPHKIKAHIESLVQSDPNEDTVYKFLLIQACNFGGKMVRLYNGCWENISIKPYWTPKPSSIRQTPSTSFTISPKHMRQRLVSILTYCSGIHATQDNIHHITIPKDAIVYIDPDYKGTYGYKYSVNLDDLIISTNAQLCISEAHPVRCSKPHTTVHLSSHPVRSLINTKRQRKNNEEWLTIISK